MSALCGECGVPGVLIKSHEWRDGCIVDRASGAANLFLYEASSTNALIDEVGNLLGIPVDNLVFKAAANAAEGVVRDSIKAHPLLFELIKKLPLHRLAYDSSSKLAKGVGAADIRLIEQTGKQGEREATVRIEKPFNIYLVSAMVVGAMRATYGLPVTYRTSEEGGGFIMKARQDPEGTVEDDYLRLAPSELAPRPMEAGTALAPCRRCGAPRELGSLFSWDFARGTMAEKAGGERMVFPGLYLLNSLIREFDAELGGTTAEIFMQAERKLYGRKLSRAVAGDDPWEEEKLREHVALRGLGFVRELRAEGDKTLVTVDNAFVAPLLAGRFMALWEYLHGREAACDYSIADNVLELSIYPAS